MYLFAAWIGIALVPPALLESVPGLPTHLDRPTQIHLIPGDAPAPEVFRQRIFDANLLRLSISNPAWPDTEVPLVFPCTPEGQDPRPTGDRLSPGVDGHSFPVTINSRYLVGMVAPNGLIPFQVVHVKQQPVSVPLDWSQTVGGSGVQVLFRFPAEEPLVPGAPLGFPFPSRELAWSLQEAEFGIPLVEHFRFSGISFLQRIPPGRYRLEVWGRSPARRCAGVETSIPGYGRHSIEFEVLPGVQRSVRLPIERAGQLEVELVGAPDANDHAALLRELAGTSSTPATLKRWSHSAKLRLVRPKGLPINLEYWERGLGAPHGMRDRWPVGLTSKCWHAPVGTFELVAEMPGGRTVRRAIQIRKDECTRVRLVLPGS